MKVAHVYPGLRYKSSVMQKEIFCDQQTRHSFRQASIVLGKDVAAMWREKVTFPSTEECFVAMLAGTVATGAYYVKENGAPDIIVGNSFGHYAGLVMAGALDYLETLETVKETGKIIDRYFSGHSTFLIRSVPHSNVEAFVSAQHSRSSAVISYYDGVAITASDLPRQSILAFARRYGAEAVEVPLRLQYHSEFMREAVEQTYSLFERLRIKAPDTPFISTYTADFASQPDEIRRILALRTSCPNYALETAAILDQVRVAKRVHMLPSGCRELDIAARRSAA